MPILQGRRSAQVGAQGSSKISRKILEFPTQTGPLDRPFPMCVGRIESSARRASDGGSGATTRSAFRRSSRLQCDRGGRVLGVSRTFAYELAARGELPVLRLGRPRRRPQGCSSCSSEYGCRALRVTRPLQGVRWTRWRGRVINAFRALSAALRRFKCWLSSDTVGVSLLGSHLSSMREELGTDRGSKELILRLACNEANAAHDGGPESYTSGPRG